MKVEKRKRFIWQFEESITGFTLLESGYGKRACFGGKYCGLGGLMGAPRVPAGRYMAPGHGWGGLRKTKDSFNNLERVLLVLTLSESGSRKEARFGGKYCGLGGLMGASKVPAGRYMAPGHGWGGFRKEKGSYGNLERVLLVFTLLESGYGKRACFGGTTYANWKATLGVIFIYHRLKTKELMFWEWFHGLLGCLNHYILHSKYFVQRFLKKVDFFLEHLMVVVTDCRFGPCC